MLTVAYRAIVVGMSLVFGLVARRVALWPRDGDDAGLAAQHVASLAPLGVRGVLCAVVQTALATSTAPLSRHHHRAILHPTTLLRTAPTLHESVL